MNKSNKLLLTSITLVFSLAYWIFSQGMGGGSNFDDMGNLARLNQVKSLESAIQFAFSGNAGPSGRPLSLASFTLQAEAWPNKPEAFIYVNILIHLLNGALVAWFSLLLANKVEISRKSLFISILTALWLLSPIQVSSVLFIVQRMTLLAGSFTLLGMIFYLLGRNPSTNTKLSWFYITLAFFMTIPATLSKENGILLPGFLLLLEFFLFNKNINTTQSNPRNKLLAAWSITILLFGFFFLYRYWPSFIVTFSAKGYTPLQHIATEVRAVVHYLFQILIPNMSEFGPFHDDFVISTSWTDPQAIAAAACLLTIAGLAWRLRYRYPLFALGIFIFIWGHALESTVIPLEPYFEHRNYIPMLGIAIALAGTAQSLKTNIKFIYTSLIGLFLLYAFSTYQYAAIWGQRSIAAQYWHSERPQSIRALLFLADYMVQQQQWAEVSQLINEAWQANPKKIGLAMPLLYISCRTSRTRLGENIFNEIILAIQEAKFTIRVANDLDNIVSMAISRQCSAINISDILIILDALMKNPHYQYNIESISDLFIIKAKILYSQGHIAQSALLLNTAVNYNFRLDIALQAAKIYSASGNSKEAAKLIKLSREKLPANSWLRTKWLKNIENMEAVIAQQPNKKISQQSK